MEDKKETAPEVPVQEQLDEFEKYHKVYPTCIEVITGLSTLRKLGIESTDSNVKKAIKVNVNIDSPLYNKSEVIKSLKFNFNKILKFYE